jgi:conjugal transfer mating pair stabilization protein TraN
MMRRASAPSSSPCSSAVSPVSAADCQKNIGDLRRGPETRNIGGYPVYRDCWRYRAQYSCVSQTMTR